jgi:hypothetical protein
VLLRISERFRCHYGLRPVEREVPVRPFPQTWNIDDLEHGRQRIILASEEYTLFSLLIPVSRSHKIELFQEAFRFRVRQLLENVQWWQIPYLPFLTFSKRSNRSIIGSQNDLLWLTTTYLQDHSSSVTQDVLEKIEQKINDAPMSYLNMDSPIDALMKALRSRS